MEQRGHPRLRMRHMPFKLNQSARDRWVHLMDHALDEIKLPKESEDVLRGFFHHMATFLMNAE
jgi:hemoglobin